MKKVTIYVSQTKVFSKSIEVTDEEFDALQGQNDSGTPTLEKLYEEMDESKQTSIEYDYAVYDENDNVIVEFDD